MTATPQQPRPDLDRPGAPAGYDTSATPTAAPDLAWAPVGADDPTTRQRAVADPPATAVRARRTVSARVAAVIAVVAFLLGVGVALLAGPLLGPGGGPGGPGGHGGAPGTSQQSGTGTSTTGT
jgi:hypothetical protein